MIAIKIAVTIYVIIQCLSVTAYAEDSENPELLRLIKACADIGDYNSETTDENELMLRINKLDIGPQGFGGDTTALSVAIAAAPTHIAGLPVAVNFGCHVTRHSSEIL